METKPPVKILSRAEWNKTPYAGTTATKTEMDLMNLFKRYGVSDYGLINGKGPNGRPGFAVNFTLKGKQYCIGFERLEARGVPDEALMMQVRRAVFYHMKALLEAATIFVRPEEILMPYLALPNGMTLFQFFQPALDSFNTDGAGALKMLTAGAA